MAGNVQESLLETMKTAAAALKDTGVTFALAGSFAAYARGAAVPTHDIDFLIGESDAQAAATALAARGMRIAEPPEGWLIKAFEDDRMIDLIFSLSGHPDTAALLERATEMDVAAIRMPVLDATDLVISWLCAFSEHHADFADTLTYVRPLREQVDWHKVRKETCESPFADAFLLLLDRLRVLPPGIWEATQ
jgi:Uncharacterised nucleotidyltransferase